jgi:hypothetical protein
MEQIMSAEVGGRMEEVEPHRSLFGPDYTRLFILLAVAIAIHAWLVAHTAVPARDSLGYTRVALNLSNPTPDENGRPRQKIDVIRTAEQPPGYPVAICMVEKVLRSIVNLPVAERSLLAAQLANAMAAVLLVIPMYLTGRILFSRNVGFAAALLFQVLPVPARMTSDGLSEGVYLLIVATAILLAVRAVRLPSVGGFLLCGVVTGLSYLVRPEGLGVAIAVGAVIAWCGATRHWPRDMAFGRLSALVIGVSLVAVPYMLLIGKITNKPTGGYISNPLETHPAPIWHGQPVGDARVTDRVTAGPALFAAWYDPIRDAGKSRLRWATEAVWNESIKSLHYVIGVLALFGLIALRRQLFSPDLGMWFLMVLGALNVALMFYLAERIWYVSERHTLQFVMISCIFAASSLKPLAILLTQIPILGQLIIWPKAAPGGLLFALVVSALPFTLQTMHTQREGHKYAGRWLAEHMSSEDWLVDPLAWGEWYAGRTLYETTHYRGQPMVKWVIVEEKAVEDKAAEKKTEDKKIHSRIPQWEAANQEKTMGRVVYQWPENPKPEQTVVRVYRIDIAPAPREVHRGN